MISSASNSSKIRLITDTGELAGTAYFEFALGKYAEKHWQKGWVYLEEEGMLLLEPVFVKIIPNFGWYSINEISRNNWGLILGELKKLKESLKKAAAASELRMPLRFSDEFEQGFFENFDEYRKALIDLIAALTKWLKIQLKTHETISVLGL
jgi:hypothetical protein